MTSLAIRSLLRSVNKSLLLLTSASSDSDFFSSRQVTSKGNRSIELKSNALKHGLSYLQNRGSTSSSTHVSLLKLMESQKPRVRLALTFESSTDEPQGVIACTIYSGSGWDGEELEPSFFNIRAEVRQSNSAPQLSLSFYPSPMDGSSSGNASTAYVDPIKPGPSESPPS